MARTRIYVDYSASTPIDPGVWKAMMPYLKLHYGNPSSIHAFGQKAASAIEQGRSQIAEFLSCDAEEIIFTSGATEANNLAIQGAVREALRLRVVEKPHIVASQIEHESVLEPIRELERQGLIEATYVDVNKEGIVNAQDVSNAVKENTILVSVMYANGVIGTIQPIAEIASAIRAKRDSSGTGWPLLHADAVQAALYLDCNVQTLGVDLLTISSHKMYGPKGIGALYGRTDTAFAPLLVGGGQERGMRAGTQNVAGIVGFGEAVRQLQNPRIELANIKIRQMRDALIKSILKNIPESQLTGSQEKRLPSNVHFRFRGVAGKDVVLLCDQAGIAASTGSACSEKKEEPDHVLLALGLSEEEALQGVRMTIGRYTKREEIDKIRKVLPQIVSQLRTAH